NGTNSSIPDAQTPAELNAQSNTAEQQFSGMTTEERLKSLQSPLDQFLSGTSLTMPAGKNVSDRGHQDTWTIGRSFRVLLLTNIG
ncbi:MAG: hypothetical protein P8Y47_13575, partial [Alphaproteobacteria bacterium]